MSVNGTDSQNAVFFNVITYMYYIIFSCIFKELIMV